MSTHSLCQSLIPNDSSYFEKEAHGLHTTGFVWLSLLAFLILLSTMLEK